MTPRKAKRQLGDWPAIGLGPIVMQRTGSAGKDREAVLAWGADRIVQYTRATLDSHFLAIHLRLHQPTTPEMDELVSDILTGKVKAKPRPSKRWLSPEALAVFKHWHDVNRANLEEGDPASEDIAKFRGECIERKSDRDKAAWRRTADMFGISPREAKKLYWSKIST